MKYVILRCEDNALGGEQTAALLEGAKTSHLQQLAHAGAAGTIHRRGDHAAIDRFHLHRALFGFGPRDPEASPGRCYAAGANLQLAMGETAWCCELITHRDGKIIDPAAGKITTKESEILIQALDDQLGSETRRWEAGHGSHHVLVVRDPALGSAGQPPFCSPELLVGQTWRRHLPRGPLREAFQSLFEQASKLLEGHPVNRVRVDLGENPANMLWLWGAADAGLQKTFAQRTGLSGAVVSNSFPMRGLAHALSLDWKEGPTSLEESPLQRLMKMVAALIERHDLVYVHLNVETSDPVERLCAMERIDHILLKSLTGMLPRLGPWRLLTAIDDRKSGSVPFIAIGTGMPQQPIAHLTARSFAESPLTFEEGLGLFPWLTRQ
jgi:2,3-bisphosphoglycerate-independent phosphoglycerate mutase